MWLRPGLRAFTPVGHFWPRLCEKSVRNEAVGKLFNFPLRLAVKRDEEWDGASRSGAFVSIFPTGNMTPDFLHTLGRFPPIAPQHSCSARRISPKDSERQKPTHNSLSEDLISNVCFHRDSGQACES
jgi:hypothetical protein